MDASAFEQVYGAFGDFHAYFAPLFGRRESRDHSRHYLQALLVQSGERRNAENLSETVPASARVMQRFLTEARWDDDAVMGRLQEYLAPRLAHPEAVWALDGSDFPKQGRKSAGVARQYCGRLGKVANCQAGMFLAYVSPLGGSLVDKAAVSAGELDLGQRPVRRRGCRRIGGATGRRRSWPWSCWSGPWSCGHLRAKWVAGDDAFGMSPSFRDGLAALGMHYVQDVPGGSTVWPLEPAWTSAELSGIRASPQTQVARRSAPDHGAAQR